MRKIFGILAAAVLAFSVFSCAPDKKKATENVITVQDINSVVGVQCGYEPCVVVYDADTNSFIYLYLDGSTVVVKQSE